MLGTAMRFDAGVRMLTIMCAVSVFGQQRPNFTGTWKEVKPGWVQIEKIEHQDPYLKKVTEGRGTVFGFGGKWEYRTDGDEHAENIEGWQRWSTVYWQGPALVFQHVEKVGYRVTFTRESWTLSDNGQTLTKARRIVNMDGVREGTDTFQKQ